MRLIVRGLCPLFICLLLASTLAAQRGGAGVKWAPDGKSYFMVENNAIVLYALPAFQRSVFVDASLLVPPNAAGPLAIQSFTVSDDQKKLLIYTNSKKVWRQNTRGDYWVLDRGTHALKQLGMGRPASSLMFAKFSPDGTKAAYT